MYRRNTHEEDMLSLESQTKIYWDSIILSETLSEAFMNEHKNNLDWHLLCYHQTLSEAFMYENKDYLDWSFISLRQSLSESFIEQFSDQVNWKCISLHQKLSLPFIKKYIDNIDLFELQKNKTVQLTKEEFQTLFHDFVAPQEYVIDFQFDTEKNQFSIRFHEDYFHENIKFKEIIISYEIEDNEIVLHVLRGILKEPDPFTIIRGTMKNPETHTTFFVDTADFIPDSKTEHLFKMLVNHHLIKRHFITDVLPITFKDTLPF